MSTNDRLKALLGKAAEKEKLRQRQEEDQRRRDQDAAERLANVREQWSSQKDALKLFVDRVNTEMPGPRKLILGMRSPDFDSVENLELTFNDRTHNSLQICHITLKKSGQISVRMGSASQMPVKDYDFDGLSAKPDQIEGIVLDFLEANT